MVSHKESQHATFIEHVQELRKRAIWSCLAIGVGAGIGYYIHQQLLDIIQKPLGQTLYNTTPTGAFSFVIKICVVFGLLIGLPVIMYQLFSFLGPLLSRKSKGMIAIYTFWSVGLAIAGALFAYFISLPAALKFLVGFGNGTNIQSIITANEYFNFAFAYILGAAVIFQIPLVLLFINRITPLKPSKLLLNVRYVLLFSFIAAAIITPTPDPLNQFLMAAPIIVLYLVGVMLVTLVSTKRRRMEKVQQLADRLPEPTIEPLVTHTQSAPAVELAPRPIIKPMPRPAFAMDIAPVKSTAIKVEPTQARPKPLVRPHNPRIISDFI